MHKCVARMRRKRKRAAEHLIRALRTGANRQDCNRLIGYAQVVSLPKLRCALPSGPRRSRTSDCRPAHNVPGLRWLVSSPRRTICSEIFSFARERPSKENKIKISAQDLTDEETSGATYADLRRGVLRRVGELFDELRMPGAKECGRSRVVGKRPKTAR
jgi:hypothetical protein